MYEDSLVKFLCIKGTYIFQQSTNVVQVYLLSLKPYFINEIYISKNIMLKNTYFIILII